MKLIQLHILFLFCLISCTTQTEKETSTTDRTITDSIVVHDITLRTSTPQKIDSKLSTSIPYQKNFGVILDSTMDLYNCNFEKIGIIDNTYGLMIEIDSVSAKKHLLIESDERCDLHNYIYVASERFSGWVYGQYVFEKTTDRDTVFTFDHHEIAIIPCQNFGIGVYDEEMDGLSFCGSGNQSPIILVYDGKKSIVQIQNEHFLEDYWTMDAHDG